MRWPFWAAFFPITVVYTVVVSQVFLGNYREDLNKGVEGVPHFQISLDAALMYLPEGLLVGILGGCMVVYWYAARLKRNWLVKPPVMPVAFVFILGGIVFLFAANSRPAAESRFLDHIYYLSSAKPGTEFKIEKEGTFRRAFSCKSWAELSDESYTFDTTLAKVPAYLDTITVVAKKFVGVDTIRRIMGFGLLRFSPESIIRPLWKNTPSLTGNVRKPPVSRALRIKQSEIMKFNTYVMYAADKIHRNLQFQSTLRRYKALMLQVWFLAFLAFWIGEQAGKLMQGAPGLAMLPVMLLAFIPSWIFVNDWVKRQVNEDVFSTDALFWMPLLIWGGLGLLFYGIRKGFRLDRVHSALD